MSAAAIFTKELIAGKNIYDAGSKVKNDFNSVYTANGKQLKENISNAAKSVDEYPIFKYSLYGIGIKALDKAVN